MMMMTMMIFIYFISCESSLRRVSIIGIKLKLLVTILFYYTVHMKGRRKRRRRSEVNMVVRQSWRWVMTSIMPHTGNKLKVKSKDIIFESRTCISYFPRLEKHTYGQMIIIIISYIIDHLTTTLIKCFLRSSKPSSLPSSIIISSYKGRQQVRYNLIC